MWRTLYLAAAFDRQTSDQLPSLQEISEKTDFRFQYPDDHQAGVDQ